MDRIWTFDIYNRKSTKLLRFGTVQLLGNKSNMTYVRSRKDIGGHWAVSNVTRGISVLDSKERWGPVPSFSQVIDVYPNGIIHLGDSSSRNPTFLLVLGSIVQDSTI